MMVAKASRVWLVGLSTLLACTEPQPTPVEPAPAPALEPTATASPDERPEPAPEQGSRAAALELSFVGDVVLGRYLEVHGDQVFAEMHAAASDPFAEVAPLLAADVVVANLESPIVGALPRRSPRAHHNRFGASAAHLEQLRRAGFDVLSLANNHYFDLGVAGQIEGPQALAERGMFAIGASRVSPPLLRVETLEVQGWRVGFLAFATVRNHPGQADGPQLPYLGLAELREQALPLLADARATHDLLIVVVHWGVEYADEVRNSNRLAGRSLLESGVDLVIGHHPHVLQAIERHRSSDGRDGLIAYSLGNFMFPRNDDRSGLTGVLRVRYLGEGSEGRPCLAEARLHPAHILRKPRWHPAPAGAYKAGEVRERVTTLSRGHGTRWGRDEGGEDLLLAGLRSCE